MDNKKIKSAPQSAVNLFFSGVLILTVANLAVKAVGLVSKIVLNRVVGSIGAGYYSSAYEIYAYLYVLSTAGLPIALSIMVAKSRAKGRINEARKIFNISLTLFLIIGFVSSLFMILFSRQIAEVIKVWETYLCIIAIAPTMLFICLSSCMRGYFQGYQLMGPTAVSQFIEAICKVGIGVGFAFWAKSKGYEDYVVAAYTILGVTIGVLLGMIFLYIKKLFFKEEKYYYYLSDSLSDECKPTKQILKELFKIAIPITVSSSVLSLTTIIDTFMVQRRLLDFGMNETTVKIFYGDYTSLVISMFNLPTILIYPIANSLVPLISAANEKKDYVSGDKMRSFSFRVIMMIAFPCALGLGVFSGPILDLLMFKQDSVSRAAPWLSIAAVSVVFLGIISATNAFLNTAGYQRIPIISMIAGAGVKLLSNFILLGKIGIYGAPISTVLCYITASSLNIYFTVKYVGKLPEIRKAFGLPLISSVLAIGLSAVLYVVNNLFLPQKISTLISILVSVAIYIFLFIKIKGVTKEEILLLPKGNHLVKFFTKIRLFD